MGLITTGAADAGTLTGTTLKSTVVSSSLTSVSTIGTGVWNGTPVESDLKLFSALGSVIIAQPYPTDKISTSSSLTSGVIKFTAIYLPKAGVITGVKWWQQTGGVYTAGVYNGVGLYSYSAGTLTLVASSTDDGTIWKLASQTLGSKVFSSPYSAVVGVYFIATLYNNSAVTTSPSWGQCANMASAAISNLDFTNSIKLYATLSGTTFPSTISSNTITGAGNTNYFALY